MQRTEACGEGSQSRAVERSVEHCWVERGLRRSAQGSPRPQRTGCLKSLFPPQRSDPTPRTLHRGFDLLAVEEEGRRRIAPERFEGEIPVGGELVETRRFFSQVSTASSLMRSRRDRPVTTRWRQGGGTKFKRSAPRRPWRHAETEAGRSSECTFTTMAGPSGSAIADLYRWRTCRRHLTSGGFKTVRSG
jgi:hypothetical protein